VPLQEYSLQDYCNLPVEKKPFLFVLGLARTGLIFTGLQEGAQTGGLTQPGQTEPGIPYHVPSCWVPGRGELGAGTLSRLGRAQRRFGTRERFCSAGLFCIFPFSVSLLLLFPLFAVLLNCPYPDPPVSACFFPFSSAPQWGEGQPRGAFVAVCSQTRTLLQGEKTYGMRLSSSYGSWILYCTIFQQEWNTLKRKSCVRGFDSFHLN